MQPNPHPFFRISIAVCAAVLVATMVFFLIYGKTESFIIINGTYHPVLDLFFRGFTFLGDGLIYIPIVLYCIFFNRHFVVAVLSAVVICTILSQGMKHYVFPDELRPFSLEAKKVIIHKIEGVPLHRLHSFPSGHTSTAFSMALLLAEVIRRKSWCFILPLLAVLVGYSRVYLAQHFVTDVMAGMVIGMITAYLSLLIYDRYKARMVKKKALIS